MGKKFTYEEVKEYIETNSDCKLLSTVYINTGEKLKLRCGCKDKTEFETTFSKFKDRNKRQCNKCSYENLSNKKSFSYEYIKAYINSTGNVLLSKEYKNNSIKLEIKCRKCGDIYFRSYAEFKASKNKVCLKCSDKIINEKQRFSYEEVKSYIESNSECKLISTNYINSKSKLKIKCGVCKKEIYKVSFSDFKIKNKWHCNKCSLAFIHSKGEKLIEQFLTKNNVEFESQYRFNDCRNIKPLPFDFYLPEYNILIEYDGEGHVRPFYLKEKNVIKAQEELKKTQRNDNIKTNYCLDHNIQLIRIPYTQFNNINQILTQSL